MPVVGGVKALAVAVPLLLVLPGQSFSAQQPAAHDNSYVDSVFRAHSYHIALDRGQLTGPGATFLFDASRGAQFFVLAESHYVAQIPPLAEALFDRLHRESGYNYYAVEFGPVITKMLSADGIRGNRAATFGLARKYPHAFQFWDDEEVAAFAHIGRTSTAETEPLWGIDQEWGALHVLDRLAVIAPTTEAASVARRMADRAHPVEATRPYKVTELPNFIGDADSLGFDSLRAAFHPAAGSESEFLLDALEVSNRIYRLHDSIVTRYRANLDRERYMKSRFMDQYRVAQRHGDSLPRVLVKVGSGHGGDWRSPTSVQSLGNFLREFAVANGRTSFHLVVWLVNRPGDYWTIGDSPAYLPLARMGTPSSWTIVDFRPLRSLSYAGKLPEISSELQKAIFAYDAVLLLGSGRRGTYDDLRAPQAPSGYPRER